MIADAGISLLTATSVGGDIFNSALMALIRDRTWARPAATDISALYVDDFFRFARKKISTYSRA
jgi:hypothetical protein